MSSTSGYVGDLFFRIWAQIFDMPSTRKVRFEGTFSGVLGPKKLLIFVLHQYKASVAEILPHTGTETAQRF